MATCFACPGLSIGDSRRLGGQPGLGRSEAGERRWRSEQLPIEFESGEHQARHLPHLRQRALPTRQSERASDLEQMPNLLNFIRDNGTLHTNHHTVLISHTANGILTDLTGVYSDRHGQSVANSYRYFKSDGSTASSSSFKYWTDIVDDTSASPADPLPNMVNGDTGLPRTMPAPWVPYTRAGCDFGSAGGPANIVLENTATGPSGDMTKVFGAGSAEWNEAVLSNAAPAGSAARNLAQTDFV